MIARVMVKTGATVRSWGIMYKAVAHSVLLYGSEIWVVMGDILKVLEGFHHRVYRNITEMTATCGEGGEWDYPLVVTAMEAAGLHTIRDYTRRQQATIAGKMACRPIYELCAEAERMPGTIRMVILWYQDVVNKPEE